MNYRIVEENRQIWIEEHTKNGWVMVAGNHVPRYHASVADARSWVATLRKGRVIHSVEDAPEMTELEKEWVHSRQWFLDRVGKLIIRTKPVPKFDIELPFEITDEDHARHLHTASVEMGYVYTDAPNIAQDERKPDDGVKPSTQIVDEFEELINRSITSLLMEMATVDNRPIKSVHVDDEHIRIYT